MYYRYLADMEMFSAQASVSSKSVRRALMVRYVDSREKPCPAIMTKVTFSSFTQLASFFSFFF